MKRKTPFGGCSFSSRLVLRILPVLRLKKRKQRNYTQYVIPFIGAADNGHTISRPCYPFGMIQTSPVTGAVVGAIVLNMFMRIPDLGIYSKHILNGTGCMDLGDILVCRSLAHVPVRGMLIVSHFPKDKEAATRILHRRAL
jgi:putative alpha-1,2-mannosidase